MTREEAPTDWTRRAPPGTVAPIVRTFLSIALLASALLPLACSSGGASLGDFSKACVASANLSEAVCDCVAKKAQAELSDDGFAFLVATLQGNDDQTAALRAKLAIPEAIAAGMFMVSGPAQCVQDLATS